jgi:hypothetical protein
VAREAGEEEGGGKADLGLLVARKNTSYGRKEKAYWLRGAAKKLSKKRKMAGRKGWQKGRSRELLIGCTWGESPREGRKS